MADVSQPSSSSAARVSTQARGDDDMMDEDRSTSQQQQQQQKHQQHVAASSLKSEDAGEQAQDDHAAAEEDIADGSVNATASSMDLISQLESDLALLLQIMSSSLHYVANRSAHVQLNEDVPLFQPVSGASLHASRHLIDGATMYENIEELTDDLVGKAKDMERLLDALPRQQNEAAVQRELLEINDNMQQANNEYRAALREATLLRDQLDVLLRHACDEHQAGRAQLAAAVAAGPRPTSKQQRTSSPSSPALSPSSAT